MKRTPKESAFKKKVIAQLKMLPNSYFFSVNQVSISGTPDILGCCNGKFIGLELKKDDKSKPTPIQEYVLGKIYDAGGFSEVVRPSSWEEQFERLKKISEVI